MGDYSNEAAIAGATSAAINNISSYYATDNLNRKTRKYNLEMYALQRQNALADWKMQNEYNSPSAQMARLREAGLNPNLVYGAGSATAESKSMPNSSSVQAWHPEVPTAGATNPVTAYLDTELKDATLQNLRATNQSINNESMLKMIQIMQGSENILGTKMKNQNLEELVKMYPQMLQGQFDKLIADIRKTDYEGDIAGARARTEPERIALEFLTKQKEQAKTDQQVKYIEQLISNLKTTGKILEFDLRDASSIGRNAPWYLKLFSRIASKIGGF